MDTRVRLYTLLDYKQYYGQNRTLIHAVALLTDIPSITLINYISGFCVNLYLSENSDRPGLIQKRIADSLFSKAGKSAWEKYKSEILKVAKLGQSPIMFSNHSNLIFYDLIYKNYNSLPSRDLTEYEARKVFDAYLIINLFCNERIKIEESELQKSLDDDKVEEVLIPNLIYQRDYISTTDFNNQITRGSMFFEYLENHPVYSEHVANYYASIHVSGWNNMFKTLFVLFAALNIDDPREQRMQLADISRDLDNIELEYINSLCINSVIPTYSEDLSFSILRGKMLFKLNEHQYFILSPNFLIDQFYKAQVFAFNNYLKAQNVTSEFLSFKAKEFMEDIYLNRIINYAFPNLIKHFGDTAINSKGTEMCDVYLRNANKVCLIEFKDVLLSSIVKNSGDRATMLKELDKKFLKNQSNAAKGITQLLNAVDDFELKFPTFDTSIPSGIIDIFPIIIYTDLSFGFEGINKIFSEKFNAEVNKKNFKNVNVHPVTFINLNFFEIWEDYLQRNLMDIFVVLEEFHKHIQNPEFHLTTFEVFCRFYMNENEPENLGNSLHFQELVSNIVSSIQINK